MGPESLARLVDRHAAALVLYARQWCAVPEDVVQDAFLKLVVQKPLPVDPVPWLFRVVRNAAISAARSARRRRLHEAAAAQSAAAWFEPDVADGLDAATAAAALERLPVAQREVLVARLWGGLTFDQIGTVTSTSSSSAHRLYHEALINLRERLGVACPNRPSPNR